MPGTRQIFLSFWPSVSIFAEIDYSPKNDAYEMV